MTVLVHVYGKPGCHLCDEAIDQLDDLRERFDFELKRHNILDDQQLFEKYRYDVPVVRIAGIDRLKLKFDTQELEAALLASQVPSK